MGIMSNHARRHGIEGVQMFPSSLKKRGNVPINSRNIVMGYKCRTYSHNQSAERIIHYTHHLPGCGKLKSCKSGFGQVSHVEVASDLFLNNIGHLAELLVHATGERKSLVCCVFVFVVKRTTVVSFSAASCTMSSCLTGHRPVGVDIVEVIGPHAELNRGTAIANYYIRSECNAC
jgi:hypothetical protein